MSTDDTSDNITLQTSLNYISSRLTNVTVTEDYILKLCANSQIESNNTDITILYSDNGKGFSQGEIDKAFEPFYTTKRSTNCTGLGLPIVYNQVTYQLRGSIEIITTVNNGAAFLIKIPADLPLSLI